MNGIDSIHSTKRAALHTKIDSLTIAAAADDVARTKGVREAASVVGVRVPSHLVLVW